MEELKQMLVSLINSKMGELSFEQVFYVVKDTYRDLYENYQKYLLNQARQQNLINRENETIEESQELEENKEE